MFIILLAIGLASPAALADMGRVSSPVKTSQDTQGEDAKPADTVGKR
jgi:hypothetical protein